jgi:signal transduction histidine kinase
MSPVRTRPPRPAPRERRRSEAQQLIRKAPLTRLFSGIQRPLARALERLAPDAERIQADWRRLLRSLAPSRGVFDLLAELDVRAHLRHLRSSDYDAYVRALEHDGEALAHRGVPEEHVVAALAFYLEGCLSHLLTRKVDDKALALSLVRLTSAIQRFILVGYTKARSAGWQRVDEQDRKRLSRDLHDEVGADLVVLKLYIEMIALELRKEQVEVARAKLEEALTLVSHALESVRRLSLDLGPAILEQVGILPAVKLYCRHFAARTGIAVEVKEVDLPEKLPAAHEATLYRVLQGALSNVAKHARARKVTLSLGCVKRAVIIMVIEDDGIGFDVARQTSRGAFGLTAMRDRIQSLGGRLHIESKTARARGGRGGTRIEIDLPVRPSERS